MRDTTLDVEVTPRDSEIVSDVQKVFKRTVNVGEAVLL
jgi:hypothetical protein